MLRTPVALLIFNRPATTARVFERVRRAKPPALLVVADGPRLDRPDEARLCREAREVVEAVDWPCEVSTNYSDVNLGCGRRVSSGLDWVFDSVERAIVLEDDCLPHPSFFPFCDELLERYRSDDGVMHISGHTFQSLGGSDRGPAKALRRLRRRRDPSYYFSRYPHVWGWASWRRAWRHYDFEMSAVRSNSDRSALLESFSDPAECAFWSRTWDEVVRGEIDTWDYQWALTCMRLGGLSAMPSANLVSNIGFGEGAHHTIAAETPLANLPTPGIRLPLTHPEAVLRDERGDAHTARVFFGAAGS